MWQQIESKFDFGLGQGQSHTKITLESKDPVQIPNNIFFPKMTKYSNFPNAELRNSIIHVQGTNSKSGDKHNEVLKQKKPVFPGQHVAQAKTKHDRRTDTLNLLARDLMAELYLWP